MFVRETGAIDNATYRDLNQVDTLNASNHLRRLRDLGLLEAREKGAATYYVPTLYLLAPTETSGEKSHMRSEKSHMLSEENTYAQVASEAAPAHLVEELPEDLRALLDDRSAWRKRGDFRELLRRLCAWRALTAEEMAFLTNRRKDYLVREYLTPMVEARQLEYTISAMPRHPNQAYRAANHR